MDLRSGFITELRGIIEQSRIKAIRSVDHLRVRMYWELVRKIVDEEQQGNKRAKYSTYLITILSKELVLEYGQAFTKRQLER